MSTNEFLTFSTFDLGLASVLVALEYKLLKLDRTNPKKIGFVFQWEKNIEKTSNKYFNNEVKLPALSLFNSQKTLKNRIFSDF